MPEEEDILANNGPTRKAVLEEEDIFANNGPTRKVMPEEEDILTNNGLTRKAEPDEEAHYLPKCPTKTTAGNSSRTNRID